VTNIEEMTKVNSRKQKDEKESGPTGAAKERRKLVG